LWKIILLPVDATCLGNRSYRWRLQPQPPAPGRCDEPENDGVTCYTIVCYTLTCYTVICYSVTRFTPQRKSTPHTSRFRTLLACVWMNSLWPKLPNDLGANFCVSPHCQVRLSWPARRLPPVEPAPFKQNPSASSRKLRQRLSVEVGCILLGQTNVVQSRAQASTCSDG
jgi:hypothetical protein